jgi:O-methyltransferase
LSRVRNESLLPYYPPPEYRGQLDEAFQRQLSERRSGARLDDLTWYHATELPNGKVLPGAWDLRGKELDYLGGIELDGKRVLELGPATGYLSFYMESQGADVVSFDVGFDVSVDTLPFHGVEDPVEKEIVMTGTIDRNHDAWWYLHRAKGSRAKFVQGNIYAMPPDLGTFDVSFFGAILLHLREPWGALRQAAMRTTEMLVVTEPLQDDELPPESNVMRFSPSADTHLTNWWSIYPGAVLSMMRRLGFGDTTLTYHTQKHYLAHDLTKDVFSQKMYTIVGRRTTTP